MTTPKKLTLGALLIASVATVSYRSVQAPTNAPVALLDTRGGLVAIVDNDKLDAEGAVRDILRAAADAGKLQHRPSVADIGVRYGQRRQAGQSHAQARSEVVSLAQRWASGGDTPQEPGLAHIGDDDILAVLAQVARIGADDWGGVFDLGTQYGVRRQAGYTDARAKHETGDWLVRWYGGVNPWKPIIPPPSSAARVGTLRLTPHGYADDTGPVLPLYAHHGNSLAWFVRDEPAALAQLDDVAAAGYQGIRFWNQLGCGRDTTSQGCPPGAYWRHWWVGPDVWPDFWTADERFAIALKSRGLRAVLSQGDITQLRDRCGYMQRLAALDRKVGGFIDFIDAANEGSQTGENDERALARFMQCYADAGGGGIRSLTSGDSEGTADVNRYLGAPAQIFDIHSFRGGHWYDKIRHIFSAGYDGHYAVDYGMQSEPAGGGDLVSAIDNRDELDDESVPLLAVSSLIGRQAFVWFSGEGVIVQRGLKTDPGFYTTPRTVALLPKTLMAWPSIYHAGKPQAILGPVSAGSDVVRTDCREGDGQAVCVVYGPSGTYNLPVKRGFVGKLCNPTDSCQNLDARAGQTIPVSFRRGRVLIVERFH